MSSKILSAVWRLAIASTPQKLVALKLADNASDEGLAFPKVATMTAHTGIGRSQVFAHLDALCALGLIVKRPRFTASGRQTSTEYQFNMQMLGLSDDGDALPEAEGTVDASTVRKPGPSPVRVSGRSSRGPETRTPRTINYQKEQTPSAGVVAERVVPVSGGSAGGAPTPASGQASSPAFVNVDELTAFQASMIRNGQAVLVHGSYLQPESPDFESLARSLRGECAGEGDEA